MGVRGECHRSPGEVDLSEGATPDQSELAKLLLRVAQRCAACTTSQDFAALVRSDVRRVLPHQSLLAELARIDLEHLELIHGEAVDYPEHDLKPLKGLTNGRNKPALARWLTTRAPTVLDAETEGSSKSDGGLSGCRYPRIGRMAAHGVFDMGGRSGTFFCFGGLPSALNSGHVSRLLQVLIPHLHQALIACHQASASQRDSKGKLTATEREIMKWVAAGRTNAEIAQLRGRSEATIKNQLTATFRKLGVSNRAAAVRLQAEWA